MRSISRWTWIAILIVPAMLVACGGGGDDDDDDDSDGPSSQGPGSSGSGSSSQSGGKFEVKLPDIKQANYTSGKVTIEVTGDKKTKIELDGNAVAVPGFALLTYVGSDASVQIGLQNGEDEEPGAVAITHQDFATAGTWGKDCKVSATQSSGKITGEFTCEKLDALKPGSVNTFKVNLKGTFSAAE